MKKLLFFVTVLGCHSLNAMNEPYASLQELPYDGSGWFVNHHALDQILTSKQFNTVIEIGSWLGCSTRFIAQHLPSGAKLYAIDTWLGSTDMQTNPLLPTLYQQFLSNVIHTGLTEVIVPVRMNSVEASKALNVKADLIYIDGAHDTTSVYNDIMAWYPHLATDGIMCGDDWTYPTVQSAVLSAGQELGKQVYSDYNFWCYY